MGRKDIKVQRWASHSLGIIFFVLSSQNLVSSPIDHHQERFEGKSNYGVRKLFILWFDMIENYHFYPLRFGSLIGFISFCAVKLLRIFNTKKNFSFKIKEKTF